jgi:glycosyltransferase involved in cell wall biosynthesis
MIRAAGADVLISCGNFALRRSPVPQILLAGNSLYTSSEFSRDLRARGAYGMLLDTRIKGFLARKSIHWADCTVAPSHAFAEQLRTWTGGKVISIYHGFDPQIFFGSETQLPVEIQKKLDSGKDALRLLFVSHYNYYRNFETLLRAIPLLSERMGPRKVKLFLTCRLRLQENPGSYRAEQASALVEKLGISDQVVDLGSIPYHLLHHLYAACDIYVSPAYTETFAHPLVEAMASGLPIVGSDLPVHREICGPTVLYFNAFSAAELAERVFQIATSDVLRAEMIERGRTRSAEFSWARHVNELLELAKTFTNGSGPDALSLLPKSGAAAAA